MKIELVKQTTKITGTNYWYVKVDGLMQSGTWSTSEAEAKEQFTKVLEGAKLFPETTNEVITEVEYE